MNALVFNRFNCARALARLGAYVDGELGVGKRRLMETHVPSCRRCSAELQRLQTLQEQLRQGLAVSLPDQEADLFWQNVERKIQEAKVPRWWMSDRIRELFRSHPRLLWGSAGVLGAIVLMFAADLVLRPSPPPPAPLALTGASMMTVVESVEGGPNSSVVLLSTPDQPIKIIWVLEREKS